MTSEKAWRSILASSLDWEQAHVTLAKALDGLPEDLRGRRADGMPNSIWELVEHMRLTQRDLLEFCRSENYAEPHWPDDYWPGRAAPPSDAAWDESLARLRDDREAFQKWIVEADVDLTGKIPHGTGQTYLRTVLVAVDHASYHIAQIVMARRLLGAWS